ncbi:MAG: hypothetical protein N2510_07520 [Ignavibacteria bacterium]|nr:hypothetical protein [Ignavibacteria bacterium]
MLFGCDDAGVVPPSEVRGLLLNEKGFPVSGARVKAGGSESLSRQDGSFVLSVSVFPYDIMVFKTGQPDIGYLYKGISVREPVLTLFESDGEHYSSDLTVTIPPMSGMERAAVIFTDGDKFQEHATLVQPNFSVNINITWSGNNQISGKLIVIVFKYASGSVVSYDKYGEKIITLAGGSFNNVNFTAGEISFNPTEANVSGILSVPAASNSPRTDLVFNFKSGGSLIFPFTAGTSVGYSNGPNFTFVVPQDLPSNVRFILAGSANGDELNEISVKSLTAEVWSSDNLIELEDFPRLIEPDNMATNVTLATVFRTETGSGLKIFRFDGNDRLFYLITDQNQTTIPDFTAFGLGIGSAHKYNWSVISYGETNVNEFVKNSFVTNSSLKYFTTSTLRSFTTRP